jgi:hypothetical protein
MAIGGRLQRDLTHDRLKAVLRALMRVDRDANRPRPRTPRNGRGGDTNGTAERREAEPVVAAGVGDQPTRER